MADRLAPDSRHSVVFQDRVVYQWSQTLNDVDIFVPLPSEQKISAKAFFVNMRRRHLDFGIVGTGPYMKVCSAARTCAEQMCHCITCATECAAQICHPTTCATECVGFGYPSTHVTGAFCAMTAGSELRCLLVMHLFSYIHRQQRVHRPCRCSGPCNMQVGRIKWSCAGARSALRALKAQRCLRTAHVPCQG